MSTSRPIDKVQPDLCDLLEEQTEESEYYVKGKQIADDVDSSAKQIGSLMSRFQESYPDDRDVDLSVEKWAYTSATTWRVSRQ